MGMMVFSEHGDAWVAHPSFLQDLRALTDSSGDLLLLGENPGAEISDLTKFFSLFVAAGGNAERLGVASDHPTLRMAPRRTRRRGTRRPGSAPCPWYPVPAPSTGTASSRCRGTSAPRCTSAVFDGQPDQRLRQPVRPARARPTADSRAVLRAVVGVPLGRRERRAAAAPIRRSGPCTSSSSDADASARPWPMPARRGGADVVDHRHRPRILPAAGGGIQRGHDARHRLRRAAAARGGHRALRRLRGRHRLRQRQHDGRGDRLAHLPCPAGRGAAVRARARAVDARAGARLRERRGPLGAGHPREAGRGTRAPTTGRESA